MLTTEQSLSICIFNNKKVLQKLTVILINDLFLGKNAEKKERKERKRKDNLVTASEGFLCCLFFVIEN